MNSGDPFDLQRFVDAQAPVIGTVREELRDGRKHSHWMWFVFPQVSGLGSSAIAQRYAIRSRDEVNAYLAHPVLGARLRECTQLVLNLRGRPIQAVFGSPDDLKFRSCMTLFSQAVPECPLFADTLRAYFAGVPDAATLERLR